MRLAASTIALVTLAACDSCSGASSPVVRPAPETPLDPAEGEPTKTGAERATGDRAPSDLDQMAPAAPPSRCEAPDGAAVARARVAGGMCAWLWAEDLAEPRGLVGVDGGDVLVVERQRQRVVALHDDDGDRAVGEGERTVLVEAPGLNHGIAVHDGHLYASSATTVYRWPYRPGQRERLEGREVVVRGIPDGGHTTRTLLFDGEGILYVSVGSRGNVDDDSSRARVMRYGPGQVEAGDVSWRSGRVWADGLRNEVGLALDARGRLWGVQNGIDRLEREDLGGDIHADNPAEELNLLDEGGRFHGYPYCWTEYSLPDDRGVGRGAQWAHPTFLGDGTHDDDWCRDDSNVAPPRFSMQAHTAPLDLMFWRDGALPGGLAGDALVSRHGSWNRPVPVGYDVIRIRFESGAPVEELPLLEYGGEGATGEGWPHRPVALAVGPRGELLITSDRSGAILALATPRERP